MSEGRSGVDGPGAGAQGRHAVIALDGASATGKTTLAAGVARALGFAYVDSGAIYRAVALVLQRAGVAESDDARIPAVLRALDLEVVPDGTRFDVRLHGDSVGDEIRTPEVTRLSSRFAVRGDVRERVRELLRDAALRGPLVVEGRDIGTDVFPDAELKLFLTADLDVRARRRHADLARIGRGLPVDQVQRELAERDARDSSRTLAPLRPAADAVRFDTSAGTLEEQIREIVEIWENRGGGDARGRAGPGREGPAGATEP